MYPHATHLSAIARNPGWKRIALAWSAYPLTMALAFLVYLLAAQLGAATQVSAGLGVAIAAAAVTWLERANRHRSAWRSRGKDVRVDAVYMIVVQGLLPVVLGLSLSLELLRALQSQGWNPAAIWPHDLPVALQVTIMLLVADFVRYWLHVASHKYSLLWRLHAVHHSVDRLYWLNVGRFHPLEKALQYLFDALPFVLMGVQAEVVALYFVFYATNGFFQHSNIELRLGVLNFLISGPELHRWHHSRRASESNHNYGNNLIIWDIVFGTWFLPRNREVRHLGLKNREYPMTFGSQMKAPLIRGIEQQPLPELRWQDIGLNFLVWLRLAYVWNTDARRLRRAAKQPRRAQTKLLRQIIRVNAKTRFGQIHNFRTIQTIADFRDRVPVQDYESLRRYIETQDRDDTAELTSEPPLLYTRTSGTTGEPKFVPALRSTLADLRRAQHVFASFQFRQVPNAYAGRFLAIVSPATEGRMPSGRPFGSASGHIYQSMPKAARGKYLLPWQVFAIDDYDLKYLLILRLALVDKYVTHMASANPSTFLKLAEMLVTHRAALLNDIRAEAFHRSAELPHDVREALHGRWSCSRDRLDELENLLRREQPSFADLWPYLRLVTTWTGGSCRTALETLRPHLPPETVIGDPGYLSSEFRGSITVDIKRELSVPTLTENFFEFVEVEDWERDEPEFLCLDELVEGRDYYIIVTTRSGLYRYFINDIVKVSGRYQNTPTIQFVRKGKGVTSITGEKLYENQVLEAVLAASERCQLAVSFFAMLADIDDCRYRLYVEPRKASSILDESFRASVDQALSALNLEYREKRASGRLKPLECQRLRAGTREALKRARLDAGQREAQYKETTLAYSKDADFDYGRYCN